MKDFVCFEVQESNLHKVLKTRTGVTFLLHKDDSGVDIKLANGESRHFPAEFPAGKKVFCIDWDSRHAIIYIRYESVWHEFRSMCYGSTVKVIREKEILDLPNVLPKTVIYGQRDQLVIDQVEKSPFGVPCAAILTFEGIASGKDLESLYIFPKDEPLIVEGFASTASAGRVHRAENIPGTGACYGDIPGVYAWISPDQKKHGWAFTPYGRWEGAGKNRPENWLDDRRIYYDPIWHENRNEDYSIWLGDQPVEFPSLPLNINKEINRFMVNRAMKKSKRIPS